MIVHRRKFLSFLAAPAIVHAGNLMPIKVFRLPEFDAGIFYAPYVPLGMDGMFFAFRAFSTNYKMR